MNQLYLTALRQAEKIRIKIGVNMFDPISIYDVCAKLGVEVRFVGINMEGLYCAKDRDQDSVILISSLRPFPRRCFTCAHELGHFVFKHGTDTASLQESRRYTSLQEYEEKLVNAFAGYLLMPIAGVQSEIKKRSMSTKKICPLKYFIISSYYGVGYSTLIHHCRANGIVSSFIANQLLKQTPSTLLKQFISNDLETSHFKILDKYCSPSIVDLEFSNYLILPKQLEVYGDNLEEKTTSNYGVVYVARKTGICHVLSKEGNKLHQVRIQKRKYVGLAENRFLEN